MKYSEEDLRQLILNNCISHDYHQFKNYPEEVKRDLRRLNHNTGNRRAPQKYVRTKLQTAEYLGKKSFYNILIKIIDHNINNNIYTNPEDFKAAILYKLNYIEECLKLPMKPRLKLPVWNKPA